MEERVTGRKLFRTCQEHVAQSWCGREKGCLVTLGQKVNVDHEVVDDKWSKLASGTEDDVLHKYRIAEKF